jgi:uncharacterized protein YeaO (DUF488 family)
MTLRVVRLGSPRVSGEGLRIGTVRRPPRGVPRSKFASGNWYDVWLPGLAPSEATLKLGRSAASDAGWRRFARRYRSEMARPDARQTIALLAALSHEADFSVGCYCEDESRCHRALLRDLFAAEGARVA